MRIKAADHQQHLAMRYLDSFKPHGLVPVLAPCDPYPGDTVVGLKPTIVARCVDCFDQPIRWQATATLPTLEMPAEVAMRCALHVGEFLGDGNLGWMPSVLRFDHVSVETVSRTALRHCLRADAPTPLLRLFADHPVKLDDEVMLLGQVFRARCTLRLERTGPGNPLPRLQKLASNAGLRLRPSSAGSLRQADFLELAEIAIRPVAWRPALIDAGPLTPDTFRTINQMRPRQAARNFDPTNEGDRQVLAAWIDRQLPQLE